MAKKKTAAGKARGRPVSMGPTRLAYIQIRSTIEWRDWVAGLAEADRSTVAELIDRALADYAKRRKHEIPPPKR